MRDANLAAGISLEPAARIFFRANDIWLRPHFVTVISCVMIR